MIDLSYFAFSCRGSFLNLTSFQRPSRRLLISTTKDHPLIDKEVQGEPREYYEIACVAGDKEVPYTVEALPWQVELSCEQGEVNITFTDTDTFLFEIKGVSLRLLPCHSVVGHQWFGKERLDLIDYRGFCVQQFRVDEGTIEIQAGETVDGITGPYDDKSMAITFAGSSTFRASLRIAKGGSPWNEPLPTFDRAGQQLKHRYETWAQKMPDVPQHYLKTAELAWYHLWSLIAAPEGNYKREPILVNHLWFNKLFAWDNCFHALGVVQADPELACAQLLILYDNQLENGGIPDPLSDQRAHYAYIKPPVHGWCVLEMINIVGAEALRPYLSDLYKGMAKWTHWWLDQRDSNGNGLAEYVSGQDSGWDNATVFDVGEPVEGADLGAHILLQMEALATMAELLGNANDQHYWQNRYKEYYECFLQAQWKDDHFISPSVQGATNSDSNCLIDRMPIELGKRLPPVIADKLIDDIETQFMTDFVLATESPQSPLFNPKGYWRGPGWAPSTYLVYTGLAETNTATATKLANNFCNTVARDNLFWENYDPITGEGNNCPAMAWTAATFLRLASTAR